MQPESAITKPVDPPMRYVAGGWPGGTVRPLSEAEGGELVRYQHEQLRAFVAELIERRESRGVSQASLARMTGLRRNTISELEAGQSYPTGAPSPDSLTHLKPTSASSAERPSVPTSNRSPERRS